MTDAIPEMGFFERLAIDCSRNDAISLAQSIDAGKTYPSVLWGWPT
jgi:hypothetical protein